jgi:dTDP-glucose 4,6-dehydratase
MIFLTGGAGFVGANFIHYWMITRQEPVLVLDALTYAGNLESLASVTSDPLYQFSNIDIYDRAAVDALLALHQPRALLHFAAESHVDRSIHSPEAFIRTNV